MDVSSLISVLPVAILALPLALPIALPLAYVGLGTALYATALAPLWAPFALLLAPLGLLPIGGGGCGVAPFQWRY
jgi:hypothetical protein